MGGEAGAGSTGGAGTAGGAGAAEPRDAERRGAGARSEQGSVRAFVDEDGSPRADGRAVVLAGARTGVAGAGRGVRGRGGVGAASWAPAATVAASAVAHT